MATTKPNTQFEGYLIYFPKTGKQFPHEYIQANTYECTPLQRTEIKAYRDSNNLLHRTTSPNYKTKITFSTPSGLNITDMQSIRDLLNRSFSNSQQRKLQVTYWDDENFNYRTMTAYMSDMTYKINKITSNNIIYSAVTFTFIEY